MSARIRCCLAALLLNLLAVPALVHAEYIEVLVEGIVDTSLDELNFFGLGVGDDTVAGATVTATWLFDTEIAHSDTDPDPERAWFRPDVLTAQWMTATAIIDVSGSTVFFDLGLVYAEGEPLGFADFLLIENENSVGRDSYRVTAIATNEFDEFSETAGDSFSSTAGIFGFANDLLVTNFDVAQTFSWAPNGDESGSGSVLYSDGPSNQFAIVNYTIASMTVRTVPEPGTLSLFGAGLLGFAIMRRRRSRSAQARRITVSETPSQEPGGSQFRRFE